MTVLSYSYQEGVEGMDGKLNGNYLRLIPGLCLEENEFIGEFKMAVDDVISIGRYVIKRTYIPTGITWALVKFDVDCDRKE